MKNPSDTRKDKGIEDAYRCAYCGAWFAGREFGKAYHHVAQCAANPARRSCRSCKHRYFTTYAGRAEHTGRCKLMPAHKRVSESFNCDGWAARPAQAKESTL